VLEYDVRVICLMNIQGLAARVASILSAVSATVI
jgi:hypothetical protein